MQTLERRCAVEGGTDRHLKLQGKEGNGVWRLQQFVERISVREDEPGGKGHKLSPLLGHNAPFSATRESLRSKK